MGKWAHAVIALAVSLCVLWAYDAFRDAPFFADLEGEALNQRFRLRGPVAPGPETVIVMIDDATIAALGRWPLSRDVLADAVGRLSAAGAKVIVFDLLFTEAQSPLSAESEAAVRAARDRVVAEAPALAEDLDRVLRGGDSDRRFVAALERAGNVLVPFAFAFDPRDANRYDLTPELAAAAYTNYRLSPGAKDRQPLVPIGLLAPRPSILAAASATAHVTILLARDGSLRYEQPIIGYGGEWFPSLPVEATRSYLGLPRSDVAVTFGEGIAIGDRFVPIDGAMRQAVNFYGPTSTFPIYSLVDVVNDQVPADTFRDRIVMIGGHALGVGDNFTTPFDQRLPGTEYYATVVDNILHDRVLIQDDRTIGLDMLAIVAGGLLAAFAARIGSFLVSAVAFGGLLVGWSALNMLAFAWAGMWLNYVFPTAAMVLNYAWAALTRAVGEQRRRRLVERHRRNLARYFSPAVAAALADRDRPFDFDRTEQAAVLFVDMVDSTRRMEALAPKEAMDVVRAFQRRVEAAVFANGGTVDKYLGDGVMACFGVPEPGPEDAANALACARALVAETARWRDELAAAGKLPVDIGVGVHYGPVLMGDVGGEQQFSFTVIGDTVNVASRLEAATREHGVAVIASDAVIAAARAAGASEDLLDGFTPLPPQRVRGRDEVMQLWAFGIDRPLSG